MCIAEPSTRESQLIERAVCLAAAAIKGHRETIDGGVCRIHGVRSARGLCATNAGFDEGGSVGSQVGGEATDLILLVMNDRGMEPILGSKVKLGADASVAGGPKGRDASADTDAWMRAEIFSYSRSRDCLPEFHWRVPRFAPTMRPAKRSMATPSRRRTS